MRVNRLRELLRAGKPTIGTQMNTNDLSLVEAVGHTGMFDYVEFLAEYVSYDLHDLDNFCRAAELHNLSSIIKVDQSPRGYLAQRGIGSGFQGVLFADCRTVDDVRDCVRLVRPETPEDGGLYGVASRRFAYPRYGGSSSYVQALRDVVVVLMVEKAPLVDCLEEALSVPGVDMIQFGPSDYSMSVGKAEQRDSEQIKAVEREVISTSLRLGVVPRAEIQSVEQAQYYLDLGVRHFCLGRDFSILYTWWKTNGDQLRKLMESGKS
jgi:2-keto-3-deoxy-L-rhamnonate aldolase RhmA